jgi:ABC-type amino acid transport substrate-binding protein
VKSSYRMVLLILLAALSMAAGASTKELRIGTFDFARDHSGIDTAKRLISEALLEHGYQMRIEYFPGKRLMAQLNSGFLDGDLLRSANLSRGFSNIVRVEESILQPCGLFFRLEPQQSEGSDRPRRVGIYDGVPEAMAQVSRRYPEAKLVLFKKLQQGVNMLEHRRIDLITVPFGYEKSFHKLLHVPVILTEGILFSPAYLHLHRRHHQLALDLVPTLSALKQKAAFGSCTSKALKQRLADRTSARSE